MTLGEDVGVTGPGGVCGTAHRLVLSALTGVGGADAEQGQAVGKHGPGGVGERQAGPVNGRGFLLALRQRRALVVAAQEGIGRALQQTRHPVGCAVPGSGLHGAGEVGDQAEQFGLRGIPAAGFGAGFQAQVMGVAQQGPAPGVSVPDPEQGVVLALRQVRRGVGAGGDLGGRAQQRPGGGVGAEAAAQLVRRRPYGVRPPPRGRLDAGGRVEPAEGGGVGVGTGLAGGCGEGRGLVLPDPVAVAPLAYEIDEGLVGLPWRVMFRNPGAATSTRAMPGAAASRRPMTSATASGATPVRGASCRATLVA